MHINTNQLLFHSKEAATKRTRRPYQWHLGTVSPVFELAVDWEPGQKMSPREKAGLHVQTDMMFSLRSSSPTSTHTMKEDFWLKCTDQSTIKTWFSMFRQYQLKEKAQDDVVKENLHHI